MNFGLVLMWFNKNLLLCHQSIHFQSFQTDLFLQHGILWFVVITYCHFRIVAMIVVDAFDKSAAPNYKQKNSNCNFLTNPGKNLHFWVNKPGPNIFIRFHFCNIPTTFREDIIRKSTFSFGHCPKRGGGLPNLGNARKKTCFSLWCLP